MGTNCAPLVADLFLLRYERDFMLSLSDNNQTDIIEAFNSTSRYLMKFSMFECNELVENCFPLFCYAPIGK